MNDNDIIKALKCCVKSTSDCYNCPLYIPGDGDCVDIIKTRALAIINRLQAEIERLEAEIDKQYEQAEADILGNMADGGASCHWCIAEHKSAARKEFAERLCEGRVSNDPVVIAVKVELEMMDGKENGTP